ncbi:Transcriptional regulatory protein ZraR [Planctomycetes bacterium Poly30]|uniref:Transcriptional regulatory protein ZraR n=1 Tax=Saltatorellus ferox TaxID=2528018 RepID=A0A518EMW2_9BACT|nr:Transcriptional regulatory protein ZraR [Planctomycetes bacterium Poly30]
MLPRVILAAPRLSSAPWLADQLQDEFEVLVLPRGAEWIGWIQQHTGDVLVIDHELLGATPLAALKKAAAGGTPPLSVALIGGQGSELAEVEARRAELITAGTHAVLGRTLEKGELRDAVRALARRRQEEIDATAQLAEDSSRLSDFASESPKMKELLAVARKVARADTSLLITGETGTGKEYLTQAIHAEGRRAKGPFVAINCAAMAESLMESELFGHAPGAFTGAIQRRRGCFELAHGGTLFLDEIGEMPMALQSKLLRALQERKIQPIGDEKAVDVDVRIIAATNRNLETEVEAKRFRADLYFRLSVVTLDIPPLRERRQDILRMAQNHVEHFASVLRSNVQGFDDASLAALLVYPWPGNVREMINLVERAVLLADGTWLGLEDLPPAVRRYRQGASQEHVGVAGAPPELDVSPSRGWKEARDEVLLDFDRRYFTALLKTTRGNAGEAADLAGIPARTLYDALKRAGIRREDFLA